MKTLAIETASPPGSIALLDGGEVLAVSRLEHPRKTTQQFASLIRSQLEAVGWSPRDIQLVAATHGPGSFTGLRIGITAAKVFAYAVKCPVVGINLLELIAAQCPATAHEIEAVVDAQRNQLFAARFRQVDEDELQTVKPTAIIDKLEWLQSRAPTAAITGTGLTRCTEQINDHPQVVPESHWTPCAQTLGKLAMAEHQRGAAIPPMKLAAQYFRKSAAEEKISGP